MLSAMRAIRIAAIQLLLLLLPSSSFAKLEPNRNAGTTAADPQLAKARDGNFHDPDEPRIKTDDEPEDDLGCYEHGCPFLPLDVDQEPTRSAFRMIRQSMTTTTGGSTMQNELSMAALSSAGMLNQTVLTLRGYKGGPLDQQINQDRAVVVDPMLLSRAVNDAPDVQPTVRFVGVFDGHGSKGELTSEYAVTEIPKRFAAALSQTHDVHDSDAVAAILKQVFQQVSDTEPTQGHAGCTATCIVQVDSKIYVANTGDSTSIIVAATDDGTAKVLFQSDPHTPEREKSRIEAVGGYVHIPKNPQNDVPRVYHVDAQGYVQYGLAMSRSIGDSVVRGIIAEPTVTVFDIDDLQQQAGSATARIFGVSVSDGLADYETVDRIASVMATAFDFDVAIQPHLAAEELIRTAANRWNRDSYNQYRDDIAIAACRFTAASSSSSSGAGDENEEEL